jgi:hypothetical protein
MPQIIGLQDLQCSLRDACSDFLSGLDNSLRLLDEKLSEAEELSIEVTGEWAAAIEHVIDDLSNFVFSISEPRNAPEEYSQKLKRLRHRLHDYYARFNAIKKSKNLPTLVA